MTSVVDTSDFARQLHARIAAVFSDADRKIAQAFLVHVYELGRASSAPSIPGMIVPDEPGPGVDKAWLIR